ncbi:hypothetical protein FLM48_19060 [Shewanella sp. Scap07]|uniref:hypothetical protein n=1 Tax=Shewanella sp. Scap07 TaxID=2589987 RepID=UPI0015BCFB6F|nr:hypothetical protein [Shewanella sp. Scap07]QLE86985.1 hypothetical protein FLM48_19060 [Shewanella sp. Scap07]
MNNKYKLSVICLAVLALTGCNDDDNTDTSGLESQIAELEASNAALNSANDTLTAENESLTADNSGLQAKAESYISNFSEQCAEAGVSFDYIDPNAPVSEENVTTQFMAKAADETDCMSCHTYEEPIKVPHTDYGASCAQCHDNPHVDVPPVDPGNPTDPTFPQPDKPDSLVDGKTGASGSFYYSPASYLNADYLASRLNGSIHNYEWAASTDEEPGVDTLAAACQLEGREHIKEMFPTDGKSYSLNAFSNQMGAKVIATVNKFIDDETNELVETPNVAIFGYGMKKEGDEYTVSMSIGKNNTCYNAVMNGDARLSYYEYDPMLSVKHERNQGARILGTLDYTKTSLKGFDWVTEVPGLGAGTSFTPEQVDWTKVGACSLVFKVEGIIPLG